MYKLTYQFESSGGNIEYQTRQNVENAALGIDAEVTLVTTGVSLSDDGITGTAIIDVGDTTVSEDVFESATGVDRLDQAGEFPIDSVSAGDTAPAADPEPATDVPTFEDSSAMAQLLESVNRTPGQGFILYSNLIRCNPFERDLWFVPIRGTDIHADEGLSTAAVVAFYREHLDVLTDEPALKIGGYHRSDEPTIHLSLVASLTDREEARDLADRVGSPGAMNCYRFELSKASLVIGEETHGPGQSDALFRSPTGAVVRSRDVAYRHWYDDLDVSFHPLGAVIDGELYRPVVTANDAAETVDIGEPIAVATYRGSESTPWQFGVTRSDGQLLLTQARGPPSKFAPVLKRFPIETQPLGDDPLVFSHTVSRRIWAEDPANPQVQSQRSEGLRTQFLYADSEGWHLIQPKHLGEPTAEADTAFEPTQLDGVAVRSSLLRAETAGDRKATVEHEYRITDDVFAACERLYALSYHEANEESIERLQWDIADATAYEIVHTGAGKQ